MKADPGVQPHVTGTQAEEVTLVGTEAPACDTVDVWSEGVGPQFSMEMTPSNRQV
jgi:hypothetical protein